MGCQHTHHRCETADCTIPLQSGRCPACEFDARAWLVGAEGIIASLLYGDIDREHLKTLRELVRYQPGRARKVPRHDPDPDKVKDWDWSRIEYAAKHPPADEKAPSGADILNDAGRDALARRVHADLADGRTFADMARAWDWPESTIRDIYYERIAALIAKAEADGETIRPVNIRRGRPRKTAPQVHKGAGGSGNGNPPVPLRTLSDDAA